MRPRQINGQPPFADEPDPSNSFLHATEPLPHPTASLDDNLETLWIDMGGEG
jgi:hypothetical protein